MGNGWQATEAATVRAIGLTLLLNVSDPRANQSPGARQHAINDSANDLLPDRCLQEDAEDPSQVGFSSRIYTLGSVT